jgi:transcriptional regulator with XRE-family HTH domain
LKTIDEWLAQAGNLGQQLRAARNRAKLTGEQVAAELGWTQSKVSKIETGRQMPTIDDVTALARCCHLDEQTTMRLLGQLEDIQHLHRQWRTQMRSGQAALQRRYTNLLRKMHSIRNAEPIYIPGLLQTPDYIRHRMIEGMWLERIADDPDITLDSVAATEEVEIDVGVAERVRRQQLLYEPSRSFEFITTEAALRILVCPTDVMVGQLDRLIALTEGMPNVNFGIVPFGVPLPFTPQNGFMLLDDDMAIIESIGGETVLRGDEAAVYVRAMRHLAGEAVYGADARAVITQALAALRGTGTVV